MHTEGGLDNFDNGLDGVDVGDDLADALHGVSAVSEEQDGGLLSRGSSTKRWLILNIFKSHISKDTYKHMQAAETSQTT